MQTILKPTDGKSMLSFLQYHRNPTILVTGVRKTEIKYPFPLLRMENYIQKKPLQARVTKAESKSEIIIQVT